VRKSALNFVKEEAAFEGGISMIKKFIFPESANVREPR
jgi:hypothetical protein